MPVDIGVTNNKGGSAPEGIGANAFLKAGEGKKGIRRVKVKGPRRLEDGGVLILGLKDTAGEEDLGAREE